MVPRRRLDCVHNHPSNTANPTPLSIARNHSTGTTGAESNTNFDNTSAAARIPTTNSTNPARTERERMP